MHIIEPLDVLDFHNFMKHSYLILTDSGGRSVSAFFKFPSPASISTRNRFARHLSKTVRISLLQNIRNPFTLKKADTDLCLPLHEYFRNPGKTGNDFKVFLFQVWTRRNEENYKSGGFLPNVFLFSPMRHIIF